MENKTAETTKKKAKNKKYNLTIAVLTVLSFVVSIAPLTAAMIINWHKYTYTPRLAVKLGLGAAVCIIFVCIKVIGKLKMPRRIVTFAFVFIMAWLLEAVLADLVLLSGLALAGEAADLIFFQRVLKRLRRERDEERIADKTSEKTAEQIRAVMEEYLGRS